MPDVFLWIGVVIAVAIHAYGLAGWEVKSAGVAMPFAWFAAAAVAKYLGY